MTRVPTAWESSVVEIPVTGRNTSTIPAGSEGPANNSARKLPAIATSFHHLWSIANETPAQRRGRNFLKTLEQRARLDSTRLVTAALLVRTEGKDKFHRRPAGRIARCDWGEQYIGCRRASRKTRTPTAWHSAYQKPSSSASWSGAKGRPARCGKPNAGQRNTRRASTKHQLGMFNRIPQLRGLSPWILMDFRSPVRQLPE